MKFPTTGQDQDNILIRVTAWELYVSYCAWCSNLLWNSYISVVLNFVE